MASSEVFDLVINTKLGGQTREAETLRKFLQQGEHPLKITVQGLDQLKQLDEILAKGSKLNFGDLSGLKNFEAASKAIQDIGKFGNTATSAVAKLRSELAGVKKELDSISESSQLLQSFRSINQSRGAQPTGGAIRRDNRQIQEEAAARQAINNLIKDVRTGRTTLDDNKGLVSLIQRSVSPDTAMGRFYGGAVNRLTDADQRRLNALNTARNDLEHNPLDFILARRSGGLERIEEERNRIAAKQGLAAGSLGSATPSIFNPKRLLTRDSITQLALGGLSGGLPGIAGGAIGGSFLGGPGVLLGQTIISTLLGAGQQLAKTFESMTSAGIVYEHAILGIASVLNSSTRVTKPDGSPISLQNQLKFQESEATKIQLAARARLLPLGIAGEKEATLVQGVTTGLAQKGIVASPAEVALISERFGAATIAQNPQLLDNPTQLRRDTEDILSGSPQAKKTAMSQLIRPALGGLENATTGAEMVRATAPLQGYSEALLNSDNPIVALNRLQAAIDGIGTSAGDAKLKAEAAGINDLAKALSNPGVKDGVTQIATLVGVLDGAGKKLLADAINTTEFFSRPFVGSIKLIQKQFEKKEPEGKATIDPRVQITSALKGVGLDETSPLAFETEAKQSPAARIKALDGLINKLGNTDEVMKQLPGLLSLRANAFGGLTDERAKAFGNLSSGAFASAGGLSSNLQEVEARKKVVDELKAELSQQLPGPKKDTIQGQLDKAQLDLSGSRTKVVQSLQSQFSNASQIAQLKASIAGGLGPAGQVNQASAELQSIAAQKEAAQVFIRGMIEQLKDAEPQLRAVLSDLISKAELQVKGFESSEKIVRANRQSAVIDERLTGVNTDTFAGERAAIPLQLERQLLNKLISPEVAKERKNSQLADVDIKEFQTRIGLVKGLEGLRDAQKEEVLQRLELNTALAQNVRSLKDLDSSIRSSKYEQTDERIQVGKQILAAGGSLNEVDPQIVPYLQNPALEKQFQLEKLQERQRQLANQNNPFRRATEAVEARQALEISGARTRLSVEQVTRPTRDAMDSLSMAAAQAQNQFGPDAPPLVKALGPQISRRFLQGQSPEHILDELPFGGRGFGTNTKEAAADSIREAQRAARAQSQELEKSIKQMASELVS